ncbi:hypothetical protein AAG906_000370 [Vitis piasezkii]
MESPDAFGSTRLSHGAPASPMHLAFHVRVSPSTLPSSSPPLEATLPSPPATGTRWQQHRRRCTWRTPRRRVRPRKPLTRCKAAAAGSVLGRRRQATAAGSTPGCRRWNTTQVAIIEAAARKAGSLDHRGLREASHLQFLRRRSSGKELWRR